MPLFAKMARSEEDEDGNDKAMGSYLIGCQQFLMVLVSAGYDFCEGSSK